MKGPELSAAVKSSSSNPSRRARGSPGRVPWLNETGLLLPSNKKNWNTFPSQRIPNTGIRGPCRVLSLKQALHCAITWAITSIRSFAPPSSSLTSIKRAPTKPNASKRYSILRPVIERIDSGKFLKAKPNRATKWLKIWERRSEFLHRKRVLLTGARNWDVASSVACSKGGPYWCKRTSISCTMDLKSDVGIRER